MAPAQVYKVAVPEEQLQLLRKKLELASFPDEIEDAGWDYGAPLGDIKRLTHYWLERFDWRKQEAMLNELPQYQTSIEVDNFGSFDIHFVHQESQVLKAIPLIFVHGWPGSFLEVKKLLPLLSKGNGRIPAFHVVAPSLPNFGFSQGVTQRGFGLAQHAEVCHKLMLELGYPEYITQGGDWGSYITRLMGRRYPSSCKASHINMIEVTPPGWASNPRLALRHAILPYSESEKQGLQRTQWFLKEGRGYDIEQRTNPQTIGYALHDSPVALLAWIYEKLHNWTDSYPWTEDEILTWISIYYFSRAGPAASARIYYEVQHDRSDTRARINTYDPNVRLGLAYSPRELILAPKSWARSLGPIVFMSDHENGGHFMAWEKPEALVGDLRIMFGRNGGAYGVVVGRDGFDSPRTSL